MDIVALLVGLGPLIGWGLFPTIASKFGGRPSNQILGTTIGTFILILIFTWSSWFSSPSTMAPFSALAASQFNKSGSVHPQ